MLVYILIIFSKSRVGFVSIRLISAKETFLSCNAASTVVVTFPPPQTSTAGSKTLHQCVLHQWVLH